MSEPQMILYRTLTTGTHLATWASDTTGLSTKWAAQATDLRNAILAYCWDAAYGAFKDNATSTTLYPQDANSMAIVFGIVDANSSFAQNISASDRELDSDRRGAPRAADQHQSVHFEFRNPGAFDRRADAARFGSDQKELGLVFEPSERHGKHSNRGVSDGRYVWIPLECGVY